MIFRPERTDNNEVHRVFFSYFKLCKNSELKAIYNKARCENLRKQLIIR